MLVAVFTDQIIQRQDAHAKECTLITGEKTISFKCCGYCDGTLDDSNNDNEQKADNDNSSDTGDDTNLALWLALMLLSGAGITGAGLYTRRKRTNE